MSPFKLFALLVTTAGLYGAAAPAAAQQDWRLCAPEGGTCTFPGDSLVRFGLPGRYVFRHARENINCTIDSFGSDPAPGVAKQCDFSRDWRADPQYRGWRDPFAPPPSSQGSGNSIWRFCAVEGGDCVVRGATRVRFGVDGRYNVRQVRDRVVCNASTFRDPAPGRAKVCEYEETGSAWTVCAGEGEWCRFDGTQTVRYGANGRYVERTATGGVACHNGTFGDPLPGMAKQCEVRSGGGGVGFGLPWQPCAHEGGQCNFRGAGMLRYGASGRYAYREAVDGVSCTNSEFGGDPAPGAPKQCELLRINR